MNTLQDAGSYVLINGLQYQKGTVAMHAVGATGDHVIIVYTSNGGLVLGLSHYNTFQLLPDNTTFSTRAELMAWADGNIYQVGGGPGGSVAWGDITGKPSVFAPADHSAVKITSGTLDGDRLPGMSANKAGAVPPTGVPSGLFLKDNNTWGTPAAGPGGPGLPSSTGKEGHFLTVNPSGNLAYERVLGTLDVKTFGAKCDGTMCTDGFTAVGDNTFTSASANFTSADIGKTIAIVGAGTQGDGNHLVTTIASINSAHSIEMADPAAGPAFSGYFIYGTDDSVAWQAALNFAAGERNLKIVYSGISVVAGALQTSLGYNAQVKIPLNSMGDNRPYTVEVSGLWAAPCVSFWPAEISDTGSIIFSPIEGSGVRPCVFGSASSSGTTYTGNMIRFDFTNATIRTMPNGSICALDLSKVGSHRIKDAYFDTLQTVDWQVNPSMNANHVGFYCSGRGSQCIWEVSNVYVTGYNTGWVSGECGKIDNIFAFSCYKACINPVVDYPTVYGHVVVSWCPYGMTWSGDHDCGIFRYQTEHWAGAVGHGNVWMTQVFDFDDGGSSYWKGKCYGFFETLASVGKHNYLLVKGCEEATIVSASGASRINNTIADTNLNLSGGAEVIPSSVIAIAGGGDYQVHTEVVFSLTGVTGTSYVVCALYTVGGGEIPNTRFTVYFEVLSGVTKTLGASYTSKMRLAGPINAQISLVVFCETGGAGSITLKGSAYIGGAGSKLKVLPL